MSSKNIFYKTRSASGTANTRSHIGLSVKSILQDQHRIQWPRPRKGLCVNTQRYTWRRRPSKDEVGQAQIVRLFMVPLQQIAALLGCHGL